MMLLGVVASAVLCLTQGCSLEARNEAIKLANPSVIKGHEAMSKGQFDSAIRWFTKARSISPDVGLEVIIGEAYFLQDKWIDAGEWYAKVVYPPKNGSEGGPSWNSPKPMLEYAITLLRLNKPSETKALYDVSAAQAPNITSDLVVPLPNDYEPARLSNKALEARLRLAYALIWSDQRTQLPNFREAVRLDPKLAVAKFYLGKYQFQFGDKVEGRSLLEEASRRDRRIQVAVRSLFEQKAR